MKVVSLLSGGIDSAVSSYHLMNHAEVILVHFFNASNDASGAETKVRKLARILNRSLKLYCVPFQHAQMEIIKHVPAKYRMIVYKRFMLKIADVLRQREGAYALAVGDSLGQVASQTLDNMSVIYDAVDTPLFTPLIGENKNAIMKCAREINTFETSIVPYQDCCSFFVSKHPETHARMEDIQQIESRINGDAIIQEAVEHASLQEL